MNIKSNIILLSLVLLNSNLRSEEIKFNEFKLPTNINIVEVEFFNKFTGIMVSESAEIFYTTNGGLNWKKSEFKLDFSPKALTYSVSGEAIIIGSKSTIIKSYDYGKNWLVISYSDTSKVIFNNIVSRSPYELYITQQDSKNIYYSIDGFQSLRLIDLNGENSAFKTYPILFNRNDNRIYCSGDNYYGYKYDKTYYVNQGIFTTINYKNISPTSHYSSSYSTSINPKNNIKELIVINSEVVRFDGHTIKPLHGDDYTSGRYIKYYSNATSCRRIFVNTKNEFILPDDKGLVTFLKNFDSRSFAFNKATYDESKIQVTDTTLFDYYQIKDDKAITTSINGKYFIYDISGVIDSLIIDTLGFTSIDTVDIDTIDIDIIDTNDSTEFANNVISIYPNPTSDYFTVEFQEKSNVESIQVFDVKGYRELNFILNKEIVEYKIDFRELQRGTYFIEIITSSGVFHKKIIKF